MTADSSIRRRRALKMMVGLFSTAIAALVAVPGMGYLLDPVFRRRKSTTRWIAVLSEKRLGDRPLGITVHGRQRDAWTRSDRQKLGLVWLRRNSRGQVEALSAECPHLGCNVQLAQHNNAFFCPCHKSAFALDGKVRGGPSPRALDTLPVRIRNGQVEVRFVRFRLQTQEKIEIDS